MPDFQKFWDFIFFLYEEVIGGPAPTIVSKIIGWAFIVAFVVFVIAALLAALIRIKNNMQELSLFPTREERERQEGYSRFARHVELEINRLNDFEDWRDYRFAELEAEVEITGRRRTNFILDLFKRSQQGARREKSLSEALRRSDERLIHLLGDPGAGKSVALRYLAQTLAADAQKDRNFFSKFTNYVSTRIPKIPIYVNLREFDPGSQEVDTKAVRDFIWSYLNRANRADVEEFLEVEFEKGMKQGSWIFLFDSFDEIPAILGATESNTIVGKYEDALDAFLGGMNSCRGIIASRYFRGPSSRDWPEFRILELTEKRQRDLVSKVNLSSADERQIMGSLASAPDDVRVMAANPMFLGLICDHVKSKRSFPNNAYETFESYVDRRLERDEKRLEHKFSLVREQLQLTAENIAFVMSSDSSIGLGPTRGELKQAVNAQQLQITNDLDQHLNALEYLKLARSETHTTTGDERAFAFAHRRFQEYFATRVLLREPDLITPAQLLTDGRWRETAVVLCQTRSLSKLQPIINEAYSKLKDNSTVLSRPAEAHEVHQSLADSEQASAPPAEITWPAHTLHILGLLQDGFTGRTDKLPNDLRDQADKLLNVAIDRGTLVDVKWSLEVAGIVTYDCLVKTIRYAFNNGSRWLREVAYRQVARLGSIPEDVRRGIREILVVMMLAGRLRKERDATEAHLLLLADNKRLLDTARLLYWTPIVDFTLHAAVAVVTLSLMNDLFRNAPLFGGAGAALLVIVLWLSYDMLNRSPSIGLLFAGRLVIAYVLGFVELFLVLTYSPWFEDLYAFSNLIATGLVLLIVVTSLLWAPCALLAAREERFVRRPLRPFVLLVPAYLIVSVMTKMNRIVLGGMAVIFALYMYIVIWNIDLIYKLAGIPIVQIALIVLAVLGLLPTVIGLITFISSKQPLLLDWMTWWRWKRTRTSKLTTDELQPLLMKFRTPSGKARVIRMIRTERLLEPSEAARQYLMQCGLELERELERELEQVKITPAAESEDTKSWLAQVRRNQEDERFDLRDETFQLFDQVRLALSARRET
jgi:hypothetical protein